MFSIIGDTMDSKAEQRVAIAKDALAWIKAGALIPSKGTYVSPEHDPRYTPETQGLQLRDINLGKCYVCAQGALFLAKAFRYDNVLATELHGGRMPALLEHFEPKQLMLIEYAFEDWSSIADIDIGVGSTRAIRRFVKRHPYSDKRMSAILRNIIKNNGTFRP
jgi:hypothetical protein